MERQSPGESTLRSVCASDIVWLLVVLGLTAAAFAADRIFWPDRVAIVLYAIPVLIASLRWYPSAVLTVTLGTLSVALFDLYLKTHITSEDVVSLAALVGVGVVGTLHALHRQEISRRAQRQQAVIATVERMRQPLTVILGYASFLDAGAPSQATLSRGLGAVRKAATDLREILDDVMAKWGSA